MNLLKVGLLHFIEKYFIFKGRLGRKNYAIVSIVSYALVFLDTFTRRIYMEDFFYDMPIYYFILGILIFFTYIVVIVKRLHDLNFSGWWFLLTALFPLGTIMLIVILFIPGTPGPNKYDHPPAD